jgi:hypothetical protein
MYFSLFERLKVVCMKQSNCFNIFIHFVIALRLGHSLLEK